MGGRDGAARRRAARARRGRRRARRADGRRADAPPAEGGDGDTEGFFSTTPPVAESGVAWNDGGGAMATTADSAGGPWINVSAHSACGPALEQGPVNGYFIFSSSGCNPGSSGVAVSYSLCGTASSVTGVDYTGPLTARSVYVPNSSQAWVRYTPVDDALAEPTETLDVAILDRPAYLVGTRNAQNSIIDNEPVVHITAPQPNAGEPNGTGMFTVTRTGPTAIFASPLTVGLRVTEGKGDIHLKLRWVSGRKR